MHLATCRYLLQNSFPPQSPAVDPRRFASPAANVIPNNHSGVFASPSASAHYAGGAPFPSPSNTFAMPNGQGSGHLAFATATFVAAMKDRRPFHVGSSGDVNKKKLAGSSKTDPNRKQRDHEDVNLGSLLYRAAQHDLLIQSSSSNVGSYINKPGCHLFLWSA
jgi:hypothetical protein